MLSMRSGHHRQLLSPSIEKKANGYFSGYPVCEKSLVAPKRNLFRRHISPVNTHFTYTYVDIIASYCIPFGLRETVAAAFVQKACSVVEHIVVVSKDHCCGCQVQYSQRNGNCLPHDEIEVFVARTGLLIEKVRRWSLAMEYEDAIRDFSTLCTEQAIERCLHQSWTVTAGSRISTEPW
jgi:hypothetical protein